MQNSTSVPCRNGGHAEVSPHPSSPSTVAPLTGQCGRRALLGERRRKDGEAVARGYPAPMIPPEAQPSSSEEAVLCVAWVQDRGQAW